MVWSANLTCAQANVLRNTLRILRSSLRRGTVAIHGKLTLPTKRASDSADSALNQGILTLRLVAKRPGTGDAFARGEHGLSLWLVFRGQVSGSLLAFAARLDAGDSMLYARCDMVERGWEIVAPTLEAWKKRQEIFANYEAGSWGPKGSFELIERDGRSWRKL